MNYSGLAIPVLPTIHGYSIESLGNMMIGSKGPTSGGSSLYTIASATNPSQNLAFYTPFVVSIPTMIRKMWVYNGATVNGNLDLGIYDAKGTRLVSSGSTAQSGTNDLQAVDVTDTLLSPGLFYLALASDSATSTFFAQTFTATWALSFGLLQQASAFALPATATFAAFTQTTYPIYGATQRTFV